MQKRKEKKKAIIPGEETGIPTKSRNRTEGRSRDGAFEKATLSLTQSQCLLKTQA